ncbi:hypothetical protein HDK77DRAFT_85987 [Phyllosticta capitalensis]
MDNGLKGCVVVGMKQKQRKRRWLDEVRIFRQITCSKPLGTPAKNEAEIMSITKVSKWPTPQNRKPHTTGDIPDERLSRRPEQPRPITEAGALGGTFLSASLLCVCGLGKQRALRCVAIVRRLQQTNVRLVSVARSDLTTTTTARCSLGRRLHASRQPPTSPAPGYPLFRSSKKIAASLSTFFFYPRFCCPTTRVVYPVRLPARDK